MYAYRIIDTRQASLQHILIVDSSYLDDPNINILIAEVDLSSLAYNRTFSHNYRVVIDDETYVIIDVSLYMKFLSSKSTTQYKLTLVPMLIANGI